MMPASLARARLGLTRKGLMRGEGVRVEGLWRPWRDGEDERREGEDGHEVGDWNEDEEGDWNEEEG